jgi:predicted O-methyltransferase YrrM
MRVSAKILVCLELLYTKFQYDIVIFFEIPELKAMQFKINTDIPGQMNKNELSAISYLASTVPGRGIIVEAGSLFGLSSWHWSNNSAPSCSIFCIDP